jgi:hypothetical protein
MEEEQRDGLMENHRSCIRSRKTGAERIVDRLELREK